MAWDPNEMGNPAWMAVEASKHGGPLNYIADIEEAARNDENSKWIGILAKAILTAAGGGILIGVGIKSCIDKLKEKAEHKRIQKEKAERAKEELLKSTADSNGTDSSEFAT